MVLPGKNAVVTGANRGIGKAIIEKFAQNGANIWACARTQTTEFENFIQDVAKQNNVFIEPVYFDLNAEEQIKKGMKKIISTKKEVDILVNNAGTVNESKLFQMTSIDDMKKVFDINFFAHILITQYISRIMIRQRHGSIINMASIAGIDGDPAQLEYVSSKAAMIGATKKLAIELGKSGVRVNAVAPGVTDTDMGHKIKNEILEATLNKTIMKRIGTTEEIANAVLFLASDLSSFITGQTLRVDGGSL